MNIRNRIVINQQQPGQIVEGLAKLLADTYALYLKTHGFHWNVRGATFHSLHTMFEEQYRGQWAAIDQVAERIRALGELAPLGYATFANLAAIRDGDPAKDSDAMVRELLEDHRTVLKTIRATFVIADEAGDEATVDLLNARTAAHEKHAWMLRATLGGPTAAGI